MEKEIDDYFSHFEKTVINLNWPEKYWLQTALSGKAQKAFAAMTVSECANYEIVNMAILKGYELVPQKLREI